MSYVVALTGGIGSGKSTIANKFASLGIPIIDTDTISRKIVMPNTYAWNRIKQHFGLSIISEHGYLNRAKLRKIIFNNQFEKKWLNNLLHPLIYLESKKQIAILYSCSSYFYYVILVIPLLFENKLEHLANRILVVDATTQEQIVRTIKRDKISPQEVKRILATQVSRTYRLQKADDIINNHDNIGKLEEDVIKLHLKYLQLAKLSFIDI